MDLRGLAARLVAEARATDERRLLVLHGPRAACETAATGALDAAGCDRVAVLSEHDALDATTRRPPRRSGDLLGETYDATVVDCHDACQPNALGRAAGTVDGGGLLVLLAPPLDAWPDRRDGFDESLAVPPFDLDDVTGVFRERLVRTLREHPGVAVVAVADAADDLETTVERDGLTDPAPRLAAGNGDGDIEPPGDAAFPAATYEACLTPDQAEAVAACESLREREQAVVLTADRGRGKSSAIGLAAAALALDGRDVLVTAPGYRNAREAFARARELVDEVASPGVETTWDDEAHTLRVGAGRVRFAGPPDAADAVADPDAPDAPDALLVDEAASLPVRLLERYLRGVPVAFATTVHGYEGAGRGFDVRFRDRLAESAYAVTDRTLDDPIRYAGGDPVEVWSFRALMLGARPPVDDLVADATPGTTTYERLDPAALAAPGAEWRLAETFGLLVLAHYRTEPDDLARLLDAPNVAIRALTHDGHPVAVALLAREGGLPAERRARMYEGERVRGNMLPDVLTTQLRDEDAGDPVGVRVLRIATHHAVRSEGLGSRLLDEVGAEFGPGGDAGEAASDHPEHRWPAAPVDYLGVGYGATPRLLRFWRRNDFRTVHLSTTRNDTSGEYSALMVRPLTDDGRALHERSAAWFARRIGSVLGDPLRDADPDVVRATLHATDATAPLDLTEREWRTVAAAAYGPGMYAPAPRPFRRLALHDLLGGSEAGLAADEERLLVRKALQAQPWEGVAAELDYVSRRACMRAFGDACVALVDTYGGEAAREEAARYGED